MSDEIPGIESRRRLPRFKDPGPLAVAAGTGAILAFSVGTTALVDASIAYGAAAFAIGGYGVAGLLGFAAYRSYRRYNSVEAQERRRARALRPHVRAAELQERQAKIAAGLVEEFKRTCRECKTVWFSLAGDEQATELASIANTLSMFSKDRAARAQYTANANQLSSQVASLRRCRSCGSSAFDQEKVWH